VDASAIAWNDAATEGFDRGYFSVLTSVDTSYKATIKCGRYTLRSIVRLSDDFCFQNRQPPHNPSRNAAAKKFPL